MNLKESDDFIDRVNEILEPAVQIDPDNAEIHLMMAMIPYKKDCMNEDNLDSALKKLIVAEEVMKRKDYPLDFHAQLYWGFANVWHSMGKISGEAMEFARSVEYYRRSSECGLHNWEFWREYGDACGEIAYLLGSIDYIHEGIVAYGKSLKLNPKEGATWLCLAYIFHYYFDQSLDETHAKSAIEAYEKAEDTLDKYDQLWIKWGVLLLTLAKIKGDLNLVIEAIGKFEKAYEYNPNIPA